jgi:hypothetical protein
LTISEDFRSKLIDGIDLLAIDIGLAKTIRTIGEWGEMSNRTETYVKAEILAV